MFGECKPYEAHLIIEDLCQSVGEIFAKVVERIHISVEAMPTHYKLCERCNLVVYVMEEVSIPVAVG